jgi:AcrR family transcriptional regulator
VVTTRALHTRARLLAAALDLFEQQGYAATTTAQIADAVGVTQMTFFRHFPTKDAVLFTDRYDPVIAEAVAAQPSDLPPFERVRRGFLGAAAGLDDAEDVTARRRAAIAAREPVLRSAATAATQATQDAIDDRLVAQGTDRFDAVVATSACLAALTAALLEWASADTRASLADVVVRALVKLVPRSIP